MRRLRLELFAVKALYMGIIFPLAIEQLKCFAKKIIRYFLAKNRWENAVEIPTHRST